jgi:hypothetical protein
MNRRKFALAIGTVAAGLAAGSKLFADDAKKTKAAKVAKHACKGKNKCKGQGGCKTGDAGCAGKNSCKGKGGCKSPQPADHK